MVRHILEFLPRSSSENGTYSCNLCHEKGNGPLYHCRPCLFNLHPHCVSTSELETHYLHEKHPLPLTNLQGRRHTCDLCSSPSSPHMYRCTDCDFDLHAHCVRARRFILHPKHNHVLTLLSKPLLPCDCCGIQITKLGYGCLSCKFYLHPSCSMLPHNPLHPNHLQHRLTLLSSSRGRFVCDECRQLASHWFYYCFDCDYVLHPPCAKLSHQVPLPSRTKESISPASSSLSPCTAAPSPASTSVSASVASGDSSLSVAEMQEMLRMMKIFVQDFGTVLSRPSTNVPNSESETCSICLEDYSITNPKTVIECGHYFHYVCIIGWNERGDRCPICRQVIVFQ